MLFVCASSCAQQAESAPSRLAHFASVTRGPIPRFDLYEELEVSRLASAEVIEAAYRTLVKRHHPDVAAGPGSYDPDRIKRLNVAHGWLTDPARRTRYDAATAEAAAADTTAQVPSPSRRPSVTHSSAFVAKGSGSIGFGPNSGEVRQFLADLRAINVARAMEMLAAKASAPSMPYAEARSVALRASRSGRHDQWLLARDAATVIAQGKLNAWSQTKDVAAIVADVAGALVVRDLIPLTDFQTLLQPWTSRPEAVEAARPVGAGSRAGLLAGIGVAAGSAVRGRRPQTLGIAATVLVAIVALSAMAFGGTNPRAGGRRAHGCALQPDGGGVAGRPDGSARLRAWRDPCRRDDVTRAACARDPDCHALRADRRADEGADHGARRDPAPDASDHAAPDTGADASPHPCSHAGADARPNADATDLLHGAPIRRPELGERAGDLDGRELQRHDHLRPGHSAAVQDRLAEPDRG